MAYTEELKINWRPILAAFIGLGSGASLIGTIQGVLAPSLIASNHWSTAQFAAIGSLAALSIVTIPAAGRLADTLGVRMTALIGQISLPLLFLAYSMMSGTIGGYIAVYVARSILSGTTTATVYTRLPVQHVRSARGAALAIVASGPALSSALLGPLLNDYVEEHGWREPTMRRSFRRAHSGS